jgi:hypothetical protein
MSTETNTLSTNALIEQRDKQNRSYTILRTVTFGFTGLIGLGLFFMNYWGADLGDCTPFFLLLLFDIPLIFVTWKSFKKYQNLQNRLNGIQQQETAEGESVRKKELRKKISQLERTLLLVPALVIGMVVMDMTSAFVIAIAVIGIIATLLFIKKAKKEFSQFTLSEAEQAAFADASKKERKTSLTIAAVVIAVFLLLSGIMNSNFDHQGGDGITTCRNCGRKKDLVPGFGFCYTCYEGFVEWQEENWTEGK